MSDGGAGSEVVIAEGRKFGLEERTRFALPYVPGSSEVVTPGAPPPPAPPAPPEEEVKDEEPKEEDPEKEEPEEEAKEEAPEEEEPEEKPQPPAPVPADDGCQALDISVALDQYPADTIWKVVAAGGGDDAILTGGPYLEDQAYATVAESVCLEPGTYEFHIFDDYGDGM